MHMQLSLLNFPLGARQHQKLFSKRPLRMFAWRAMFSLMYTNRPMVLMDEYQ
jgi:hypothetical protein